MPAAPLTESDWRDSVRVAAAHAARSLRYAAAPAFAVMALLSATQDAGSAPLVCSAAQGSSPIAGMTLMYALMSVIHAPPWIEAASARSEFGRGRRDAGAARGGRRERA